MKDSSAAAPGSGDRPASDADPGQMLRELAGRLILLDVGMGVCLSHEDTVGLYSLSLALCDALERERIRARDAEAIVVKLGREVDAWRKSLEPTPGQPNVATPKPFDP